MTIKKMLIATSEAYKNKSIFLCSCGFQALTIDASIADVMDTDPKPANIARGPNGTPAHSISKIQIAINRLIHSFLTERLIVSVAIK